METPTRLKLKQKQLHAQKKTMKGSKCPVCNKKFGFRQDLFKHIQQFHRHSKFLKCRQCRGMLFHSIQSFVHHIKTHDILFKKNHHCQFCYQTFNSKFRLSRHLMIHTGDQLSFSTFIENKYKHNDIGERPYACSLCEKRYTRRHNLRIHELKHLNKDTEEHPYACSLCDKSYIRRHNLRIHELKHLNNSFKEYVCKICCKSFEQGHRLMNHFKIHAKERLFSCFICNKAFKLKYSLQQHQLVHLKNDLNSCDKNSKRLFSCSLCEKSYNHERNLAAHQKIHLTQKLQYSCSLCEKSYKRKSNLTQHQKIHVKNNENKKALTFSDKELLMKNILLHSTDCSASLIKASKENDSQFITLKYVCKLCSKSFKTMYLLKRHFFAHKSKRSYPCSMCNKTFKNKYDLSRHHETHTSTTDRPACNAASVIENNCDLKKQIKIDNKSSNKDLNIIKVTKRRKGKTIKISERKEPTIIKVDDMDTKIVETNIEKRSSISYRTMNDCIENEQEKTIVLNSISDIKEEIYSDNDSRDNSDIKSVIDICKTEFIYDHAIISAAKRIEDNYTSTNLTFENSFNIIDSQSIQKLNKNNIITKLKLRYKLLRGSCTLCDKVFECQENFVKHGLELHPNPEVFRSSYVKNQSMKMLS